MTSQDDSLPSAKSNSEYQFYDDAAERFERMQKELLLSNLDSMPFRQAQMRTNRRVNCFCFSSKTSEHFI